LPTQLKDAVMLNSWLQASAKSDHWTSEGLDAKQSNAETIFSSVETLKEMREGVIKPELGGEYS
jgi:hypothetical protein